MNLRLLLLGGCPHIILLCVSVTRSERITPITAVEGISTNINIQCDLNRHNNALYWRINDRDYDLYSVPDIFIIDGYEVLTLKNVNRNMNGWRFFCFTVSIDSNNELRSIRRGQVAELTVVHVGSTINGEQNVPLRPSLDLHYQQLWTHKGNNITFDLMYHNTPPCDEAEFRIEAYRDSEVMNAASESSLQASQKFELRGNGNFTIKNEDSTYFRLFTNVSYPCDHTSSQYLYSFSFNGSSDVIAHKGMATFEIPEHLHNNPSLQLIWSKDDGTQCVCPPVEEIMPTCACNMQSDNNVVTISNSNVTISNLTSVAGIHSVTIFLVISTSAGCQGRCNLRSIVGAYKVGFQDIGSSSSHDTVTNHPTTTSSTTLPLDDSNASGGDTTYYIREEDRSGHTEASNIAVSAVTGRQTSSVVIVTIAIVTILFVAM